MACTSFFALAYTLNHGAHIRVSIFLNMNDFLRYWLDAFAMLISAITATYFARYAVKTNFFSEMLNDRTQGLDQVPEWVLTVVATFGTPGLRISGIHQTLMAKCTYPIITNGHNQGIAVAHIQGR